MFAAMRMAGVCLDQIHFESTLLNDPIINIQLECIERHNGSPLRSLTVGAQYDSRRQCNCEHRERQIVSLQHITAPSCLDFVGDATDRTGKFYKLPPPVNRELGSSTAQGFGDPTRRGAGSEECASAPATSRRSRAVPSRCQKRASDTSLPGSRCPHADRRTFRECWPFAARRWRRN